MSKENVKNMQEILCLWLKDENVSVILMINEVTVQPGGLDCYKFSVKHDKWQIFESGECLWKIRKNQKGAGSRVCC